MMRCPFYNNIVSAIRRGRWTTIDDRFFAAVIAYNEALSFSFVAAPDLPLHQALPQSPMAPRLLLLFRWSLSLNARQPALHPHCAAAHSPPLGDVAPN